MSILGFSLIGIPALVIAIVALMMILKVKFLGIAPALNGALGKFAVIVAILALVVSFSGAYAYGSGLFGGAVSTASLDKGTSSAITGLSCVFATPTSPDGTVSTFRADPAKLDHYYADIVHTNGTGIINGTLNCDREGDVNSATSVVCYAKASSFRSQTSTTDSNTYYWVATSASASKVPGFPWAQTIYLNSGSVATTASDQEKTNLLWTGAGSAQKRQVLGYRVTLPGATPFSYLNNQTSGDVKFFCIVNGADQQVAELTLTKTSA